MTLFKAVSTLALLALACAPLHAQDRALGDWHGTLATPSGRLTLLITLRAGADGSRRGDMTSVDQDAGQKMPLANVTNSGSRLAFSIPSIGATYEGEWMEADQSWSGVFRQGMALPLVLKQGALPVGTIIEGVDGTWRGSLQRGAATLRLVLRVTTTAYGTRAMLDSPDAGAMGLNVEQFERTGDAVAFRVPVAQVQFSGTLDARSRSIGGSWSRMDQPAAQVTFVRDSAATATPVRTQWPVTPRGYRVEDVSFDNPADVRVTLAGTLTVPEGKGRFPAVVLISGSGAQDRDETIFGHKPFAVLADHFSRRGIAVLRYDDRGFASSTGDHVSATSADFATDANAAVRYLRGRPDIDPAAIGFVGHSEGGMIGPIAAAGNDRVAFLVLLAGPGTATDQLMLAQQRLTGRSQGITEAQLDRAEPVLRELLRAVRGAVDSSAAVARVRELLTNESLALLGVASAQRDVIASQFTRAWMRYFLTYEPSTFLSRIRVPVLAINGSMDRQVPSGENLAAIRVALAQNADASVRELPGLNHFFQTTRTGAIGEYETLTETFAPGAMVLVSEWILQRFTGAARVGLTRDKNADRE